MKLILIIFLTLFCLNNVQAQSHDLSKNSNCKFNKNENSAIQELLICSACEKIDNDEKEAIKNEDQRRIDERETFGALAIDRNNGFYYGWSYDNPTLDAASKRAVDECNKTGGDCSVVLTFTGAGCAAYRTINGNVGTACGWGLAKTR